VADGVYWACTASKFRAAKGFSHSLLVCVLIVTSCTSHGFSLEGLTTSSMWNRVDRIGSQGSPTNPSSLVTSVRVLCWLQLLGFKLGVFHVELKATSRGPRLIEINARMGGGPVR
jgi:hypothetical protein